MTESLVTRGLVKQYHKRKVVDGVSLEVERGRVVGILGPNGAGKTTTFRMVVGLVTPDSGTVLLSGKDITHLPMYKRALMGIGYLPQEPTIFRQLSVRDNIIIILEGLKMRRKERKQRVESLLDEMELSHLSGSRAGNLSGGERRRLEVTRVLATSPSFMLWDEPFAAVDPTVVKVLQKIILDLKQRGIGIFITDHKPKELLAISDYGYVISKGRISMQGDPVKIINDKKTQQIYLADTFKDPFRELAGRGSFDALLKAKEIIAEERYQEAISLLTDIIASDFSCGEARLERGKCFYYLGDYVSAVADFKRLGDSSNECPEAEEWLKKTQRELRHETLPAQ